MVSAQRASVGNGNLQCGNECGSDCHATGGSLDHHSLRMAMGISADRSLWASVVPAMDGCLSETGRTSAMFRGGTCPYSERRRKNHGTSSLGPLAGLPPNLGVRARKIFDRSDLVVLPLLGAGIFATRAWL